MTSHDGPLRRELRLERVNKYIKKTINTLNNKEIDASDYYTLRNLYKTKAILIQKMLYYCNMSELHNNFKDKLLAILISNIIENFNSLKNDLMSKAIKKIAIKHLDDLAVESEYGSSLDGGYDSY